MASIRTATRKTPSKAKAKSSKARKSPARSSKTAAAPPKASAKRAATRTPSAKPSKVAKPAKKSVARSPVAHTEFSSTNPDATRTWLQAVLGWKHLMTMPSPNGPYHMLQGAEDASYGIRNNNPPETPGTIAYMEIPDIQKAYKTALAAGAVEMMAPNEIPGGMGWMALVRAPGGPMVGLWSMSK